MPRSLPCSPRKMFPPPITTTTSTPNSRTSRICRAISLTDPASMPVPVSPPSASPLSLSRIRRYFGPALLFMNGGFLHAAHSRVKLLPSHPRRPNERLEGELRERSRQSGLTPQMQVDHSWRKLPPNEKGDRPARGWQAAARVEPRQDILSEGRLHQGRRHQLLRPRRARSAATFEGPPAHAQALPQRRRGHVFLRKTLPDLSPELVQDRSYLERRQ